MGANLGPAGHRLGEEDAQDTVPAIVPADQHGVIEAKAGDERPSELALVTVIAFIGVDRLVQHFVPRAFSRL